MDLIRNQLLQDVRGKKNYTSTMPNTTLQSLQSSCRTEKVIWSWSTFQTLCFPPGSLVPQQAHYYLLRV